MYPQISIVGGRSPLKSAPMGYAIQRAYHPFARFTGARATTMNNTHLPYIKLCRFVVPGPCIITALSIQGTATALDGSNLQGKVRLYDVNMSNGRPTVAISEEKVMTFQPTTYDVTKQVLASPVYIPKPKHIIIASMFDTDGFTTYSFNGSNGGYFGGDENFVNPAGERVTSASLNYAGGFPADWTSVASPTYSNDVIHLDWVVYLKRSW